jgi:uncharacterized protein (DUF1697 family)
MALHAAFLRGMNLGGRRITNEELRSCFEAMGCDGVATFRASGNLVFEEPSGEDPADLGARLEEGLAEALGYEVPVFLRSDEEVRAIAAQQPFAPGLLEASTGKLQVALLLAEPGLAARKEALELATDEDRLAIVGRELYWLPSGRLSDSALDLKAIDRVLGRTTMRTRGTIEEIAARYFA